MTDALRIHTFASLQPGPRLVVLGGVHGNETCGTQGILQAMDALDAGTLKMVCGQLTLVPVANPLARARMQRDGERNLNRSFRPSDTPPDYEARITNVLCPVLAAHDALLDLHSFQGKGAAFAMIGPRNNRDALEPFDRAEEEGRLALHLGVQCVVEGWLDVYAAGIDQRGQVPDDAAMAFGWGTNEYVRSQGGIAVTLECGQHDDAAAPGVAYRAIEAAMRCLRMLDGPAPAAPAPRLLHLLAVTDRLGEGDRFSQEWASFDPVARGQTIATRANGAALLAPRDGYIVFPNAVAPVGTEWYYFAVDSDRAL